MKTLKDGLYHKDIFLPIDPKSFRDVYSIVDYTHHALEAADNDRYGRIDLPDAVNFSRMTLVEAEIVDGKIFKVVVRQHYNQQRDLVMVVLTDGVVCKTVWSNLKNDKHKTLKKENYIQPY